jgi:hypothetical protein
MPFRRLATTQLTSIEAGAPQIATPPSPPTKKRSSDGTLPPVSEHNHHSNQYRLTSVEPKRVMSTGSSARGGDLSTIAPFASPKFNTPEMPSVIAISQLHHESNNALAVEPSAYYNDLASQDDGLHQILKQPTPTDMENIFPSAGLNLEMDDFQWFTQSESYISATPSAADIDRSAHTESLSGISSHASFQQTNSVTDGNGHSLELVTSSRSQHLDSNPQSPPCLCDPLSLGIISELYTLQLSHSPLDTALLLARRGLSTVSSYLACPSCLNHLSSSPSLFLACVLILQQVFTCYITLRLHGTRMLSTLSTHEEHGEPFHRVAIGDFEVEGEESCNVLLDAIVRAEMEKGKGVIGGLEQWVEKVGDGKDKMIGVLLQSLREEIGVVY